jgi:hypothetical protein
VPPAVANASYKQQQDNQGHTEIVEIKNRGHALTIDSGWREGADTPVPSSNDSHSRSGADPTEPSAYAPTMAGHRDIGLGIRDDDRFLRRRSEFPVAQRARCIAKPSDPGQAGSCDTPRLLS